MKAAATGWIMKQASSNSRILVKRKGVDRQRLLDQKIWDAGGSLGPEGLGFRRRDMAAAKYENDGFVGIMKNSTEECRGLPWRY